MSVPREDPEAGEAAQFDAAQLGNATQLHEPSQLDEAFPADASEAATPAAPLRPGQARDDAALLRPAEWLLLVVRRQEDGRYLLVRPRDAEALDDAGGTEVTRTVTGTKVAGRGANAPLAMLQTWPPHRDEGLEAGLASIVETHLGVHVQDAPRLADVMRPARMGHPYTGGPTMGLLRAVALEVSGTPQGGGLFVGCEALTAAAAEQALATELQRAIFRDGLALFTG